ncbi:hypothetical protein OKW21_006605 [Catalinimonas alkaloidigena]|nr:hypothetical protein [Catalinimonas alkaloidigena]
MFHAVTVTFNHFIMKSLTQNNQPNKQRQIIFPSSIAEIRVSYFSKISDTDRPKVTSSQDAHEIFRARWKKSRIGYVEEFKAMLLNRANGVPSISPWVELPAVWLILR